MKKNINRTNISITNKIIEKVKQHIVNNINLYIIVSIFFFIGIVIGVLFFNNASNEVQNPINDYIDNFIIEIKNGYQIDYNLLFKQIVINDIIYVFIIWFLGCTIIGIPVVYTIITWKGFSLGYCISTFISFLGVRDGIIFCFLGLFLQNIIIIPTILALGVSGNKLYKTIVQDKRKENIKIEIIKHTLFSLLMLVLLLISALIETYISSSFTCFYIKNVLNG